MIEKVLEYELAVARYDRKVFLNHYDSIIRMVITILAVLFVTILYTTFLVFRSVQKEQTKLEEAAKKLKKLNKQLEDASYTDALTGLHNRRYFNLVYEREVKRAKREKRYISFMMIDIDYFKQYNDTYGHIAGDQTLKTVANVINGIFRRPSDFVFRLGGEEFGVLLSDTDELGSARLAKILCKRVRERGIEHKGSQVSEAVTVSIGVVSCIADESLDEEALIQKADAMLYAAKEGGRNRYVITSNLVEEEQVRAEAFVDSAA